MHSKPPSELLTDFILNLKGANFAHSIHIFSFSKRL